MRKNCIDGHTLGRVTGQLRSATTINNYGYLLPPEARASLDFNENPDNKPTTTIDHRDHDLQHDAITRLVSNPNLDHRLAAEIHSHDHYLQIDAITSGRFNKDSGNRPATTIHSHDHDLQADAIKSVVTNQSFDVWPTSRVILFAQGNSQLSSLDADSFRNDIDCFRTIKVVVGGF